MLNFGLDHDAGLLLTSSPAAPATDRGGGSGGGGGDASLQGGACRADAAFSGASIRLLMSRRAVFHVVSHGLVTTSVLAGACVAVCVAPLAI